MEKVWRPLHYNTNKPMNSIFSFKALLSFSFGNFVLNCKFIFDFMDELPEEILEAIFSHLSPYKEYGIVACVCKTWKRIIYGMSEELPFRFEQNILQGKIEWFSVVEGKQTTSVSPRTGQAVCYSDYARAMFIFGGKSLFSAGTGFNDLLKLDMHLLAWVRPIAKGAIPRPKFGCSLDSYKKYLILFGGSFLPPGNTLNRGTIEYSSDLHIYNLATGEWTYKPFLCEECPKEIYMPKTCIIDDHDDPDLDVMIMYGGFTSSVNVEPNQDMWCLHLSSWLWEKQTIICENMAESFNISKTTFHRLNSNSYSSAVLVLGQSSIGFMPLVWTLCRTGVSEWTVQKLVISSNSSFLFSNINLYMPSLLLGKTLIVFRSTCSELVLPNMSKVCSPKVLHSNSDSNMSTHANQHIGASPSNSVMPVRSKIFMYLLDLTEVETDGLVKCVSQLDNSVEKLLPSYVGLGISSNFTAVLGRGEIILHSTVKSGKRSYMSLSLVRGAR